MSRERIENYPLHDSMRGQFGFELYKAMEENPNVVLLTADLGFGMLTPHQKDFPDRFINCGASETTMLAMAVGIAQEGKVPVCYSITPFLLYRGFEVIRNYFNGEGWPVILVGGGRDDDYAHDGPSHHAFEDRQVMEVFDNVAAHWPETKEELSLLVEYAVVANKPVYINLRR